MLENAVVLKYFQVESRPPPVPSQVRESVRSERSAQSPLAVEGGWHIPDDTEVSLATEWTEGNYMSSFHFYGEWVLLISFYSHFTKGNNFYDFLFASLDDRAMLRSIFFLKGKTLLLQ